MLSTVVVYIPLSLSLVQTLTVGAIDAPSSGGQDEEVVLPPSPFSTAVASASLRSVSHPLSLCLASKPWL
jgi:hypothetical protein